MSKAVLILCLTMLLVVIVPAIWSWHKSGKSTVAAVIPPASQTTPAAADEGSIPVHDESGQLVGQLTKMPADADRNATINATSNVDQKSGKELMNIISKY